MQGDLQERRRQPEALLKSIASFISGAPMNARVMQGNDSSAAPGCANLVLLEAESAGACGQQSCDLRRHTDGNTSSPGTKVAT